MLRTEKTNSPTLIAANPAMTSINTALEVDLYGQANASRVAGRIHSGYGGQTDFIVGAVHSSGGQALIALRSWHPKADVSTIVPLLDEPVTSFQPSAVVTEHGVAPLFGRDQRGRMARARRFACGHCASQLRRYPSQPRAARDLWHWWLHSRPPETRPRGCAKTAPLLLRRFNSEAPNGTRSNASPLRRSEDHIEHYSP
jgi:hypothetical protein